MGERREEEGERVIGRCVDVSGLLDLVMQLSWESPALSALREEITYISSGSGNVSLRNSITWVCMNLPSLKRAAVSTDILQL